MKNFYVCRTCGKVMTQLTEKHIPTMCCGSPMEKLVAGTTEASIEKHIPVYEVENGMVDVCVGAVEHPMSPEHFIEWVAIETNKGSQIKHLAPNTKPECKFVLLEDEVVLSVYAYCNLHSLWKA